MGFGPFLSKEEKARINASMKRNGNGLIQGVGERITPEENERRRRAASPEGMGLTQKDLGVGVGPFVSPSQKTQINTALQQNHGSKYGPPIPEVKVPTGGRSARRREEREAAVTRSQTPYVPPAPTTSTRGRKGGVARPTGGIQIGVPQSSPISTRRPNRSSNTTKAEPTENPTRSVERTGSVKKPSAYSTEAALTTIKPSRDYQKEASIDLPTDDRNDTRINGNGVIQTGTNTSPPPMTMDDASKLLSGGYKMENPYSSNQLPYTQSSPYAGKSNSQIYNPETLHQHDSDVDYVSLSKDIYKDQSGVELSTRNGGMKADYKQMDVNPGQQAPEEKINWANRTMADNSDEKVRRRAAMLDDYMGADGNPVGLMERMRNQEAIQGRKYAGGKHWQVNKNAGQEGEDDFVQISAGQNRARSNYTKTADEVFANHLGKAKETVTSQDTPDLPKDAPAMLPGAVPGQTPMDKSPFDTEELMQQKPSKSIIGNNSPYTSTPKGTLF